MTDTNPMTSTPLGRTTHGGRHGYLIAIEDGWLTIALDCAEVDEVDTSDEPDSYWTHAETGRTYYLTDIRIGA